jgi:hypothetical membrane protein
MPLRTPKENNPMTTASSIPERSSRFRLLLICGVIGPVLFIVAFLIEGATRPDYSALRHPVSSLSIGDLGWMQIANFIISGSLLVAFAVGLGRALPPSGRVAWGSLLIGLVGVGLIGSGIFVTDPLSGYPPGTPLIPTDRSVHGILHDLFGIPVFLGLPIACFVFSRRFAREGERGWATYSLLTGIAMFGVFILARLGFRQTPGFADFGGLFQRITIIIGFAWIALLALRSLREKPAAA